jgi:hypothetical protein
MTDQPETKRSAKKVPHAEKATKKEHQDDENLDCHDTPTRNKTRDSHPHHQNETSTESITHNQGMFCLERIGDCTLNTRALGLTR